MYGFSFIASIIAGTILTSTAQGACSWAGWQSKVPLFVTRSCPFGTAVSGIRFHHEFGKNLTYQEQYDLYCCTNNQITSNNCEQRPLTSKVALTASQTSSPNRYMRGLAFHHPHGADLTYQESFALEECNLRPNAIATATYQTSWVSKADLTSTAYCPAGYIATGIGFKHPHGQDYTYQESFMLFCRKY